MTELLNLELLSNKETRISVNNHNASYAYMAGNEWTCHIARDISGSRIEVTATAASAAEAITAALSKWSDIMRSPRQVFEGALLEAPAPASAEEIDNEIPF